jgi:hypothetical protein
MGEKEISEFISYLAVKREVASSTQNQALNAIVFLYKQVLHIDLGDFGPMERAKKPERLPVVLSKNEARRVLLFMSGVHKLMAQLLYGCGLRLMECVRLRVKDIDFDQNQIIVRDGKGMKERSTMLPELLRDILRDQIQKVKMVRDQDIKEGSALPWIGRLCASRQLIADSESRFAGLVVFRPEWSAWGHDVSFSGLSRQRHWSSRLNRRREPSFRVHLSASALSLKSPSLNSSHLSHFKPNFSSAISSSLIRPKTDSSIAYRSRNELSKTNSLNLSML